MLKEKIKADLIAAMKAKSERELETLRMLSAAILKKEKEKTGTVLEEDQVLSLIFGEVKKRREALEFYRNAKRDDLVDKEMAELGVLERYLPAQLSDEELKKIAQDAIAATGASSVKDMGKVIGQVMGKIKGQAEGSRVSAIVKELLSPKQS